MSLLSIAILLANAIFAQAEGLFLLVLAEVNVLPDVKNLRFNIVCLHNISIREPAKLKIGTPMPKLVQFTSFNN